ncbi:aspartate-semialdehyde dehydrogenase [bacterium endosymbiont of Pedicinus badii]|uniref:aspartate-semialdehyde dehydrogenase n=1 Tax=bacterium endosymbiont of Pedicinus badii TaxID=1719126 RepID=UPI0009BA86DF|nr:aspartate-semialdehyde dehydrogenase [bacterium endosymbiont of Pedicinus badii]OQM34090.1 hypothetical protein AOQ89_01960 [bacterium endosymbiont of Pedicinus badii]
MKKVGFVGWRGMVGSILLERIIEKNFFSFVNIVFLSTSKFSNSFLKKKVKNRVLQNAFDLKILYNLDIIINCQGEHYTKKIYYTLRKIGWKGYWLDSSKTLRMQEDTMIALDPINSKELENSISKGIKNFAVGNCTVNLMLMSLGGLFQKNLVEKIFVSTYQSISGGGSKFLKTWFLQMKRFYEVSSKFFEKKYISISQINKAISHEMQKNKKTFKKVVSWNVIPWIGKTKFEFLPEEEWKGEVETKKILNQNVSVYSTCVRINALCCHSQSFIIKLKKDISLNEIENILKNHSKWIRIVPNKKKYTEKFLNPFYVSGSTKIFVGRIAKSKNLGKNYVSVFSVADQLIWGSSEPILRVLKRLIFGVF